MNVLEDIISEESLMKRQFAIEYSLSDLMRAQREKERRHFLMSVMIQSTPIRTPLLYAEAARHWLAISRLF
jgi:hypothetical protein